MTTRQLATLCTCVCAAGAAAGTVSAAAQTPATVSAPSLFTRPGELLGQTLRFRGAVAADQAGRTVQVQRQQADGTWAPTAMATVAPDGSFIARWQTNEIGRFAVRAIVADPTHPAQAQAAASPLTTTVTIYRPVRATWYGPGFFGKRTACGQVLRRALLGVAHRTLPCGTPVEVFYGGRSVTVPVVDRGPFANGARYDLTFAAARAVGLTQTDVVGVVPQRGARMPPPPPLPPSPYAATGGTTYGA